MQFACSILLLCVLLIRTESYFWPHFPLPTHVIFTCESRLSAVGNGGEDVRPSEGDKLYSPDSYPPSDIATQDDFQNTSPYFGGGPILLEPAEAPSPPPAPARDPTNPPPPPYSRSRRDDRPSTRDSRRVTSQEPPSTRSKLSRRRNTPTNSRSRWANPYAASASSSGLPSSSSPQESTTFSPRSTTPPPTRVYQPPGTFDLLDSPRRNQARQTEDQQVFRLLGLFGNPNLQLLGATALAVGAAAFLYAWQSGSFERSSATQQSRTQATDYMYERFVPAESDLDVRVEFDKELLTQPE